VRAAETLGKDRVRATAQAKLARASRQAQRDAASEVTSNPSNAAKPAPQS
jgi:hypothetical protein